MLSSSIEEIDSPSPHEDRLLVFVRLKPSKINDNKPKVLRVINSKSIIFDDNIKRSQKCLQKSYVFDYVFDEDANQEKIYQVTTAPLVKDVLYGYNGAIFAYGATGTGKTFTMLGDNSHPGIMVQALCDIVDSIEEMDNANKFKVTVSYLEIYNEQIRDLLNPSVGYLELREDTKGKNVRVSGLSEITIITKQQILKILLKGNKERTIEPTNFNKTSSRSHALLIVNVHYTNATETKIRCSRLIMIDLAGSEKANKTLTKTDKRVQKEGSHINRSLLALGNCINAISMGARFVNFRDSKLTRLLKGTLSGNCKTIMIAHISPLAMFKDESRTTLSYAERANFIRTKVERNSYEISFHVTQYQNIIRELQNEINKLKLRIRNNVDDKDNGKLLQLTSNNSVENHEISFREQVIETFNEQMVLRKKLMEIESNLLGLNVDSERLKLIISKWEARNNKIYGSQEIRLSSSSSTQSFDENSFISETEDFENVQSIWSQLSDIDHEQENLQTLRATVSEKLAACKNRSEKLQIEIKSALTSNEEKEFLKLLCRVYELEVDKISLKSENLIRVHELRRKNLSIFYFEQQRQICEEIILKQRELLEKSNVKLSNDLQELYKLYQQDIQESIYVDTTLNSSSMFEKLFGEQNLINNDEKIVEKDRFRNKSSIDDVMGPRISPPNHNSFNF